VCEASGTALTLLNQQEDEATIKKDIRIKKLEKSLSFLSFHFAKRESQFSWPFRLDAPPQQQQQVTCHSNSSKQQQQCLVSDCVC